MPERFDPLHLTAAASLNQTLFADLPAIEPGLRGARAYDWLAAPALRAEVLRHAPSFGIDAAPRDDPLLLLDATLAETASAGRDEAQKLAALFGRRLGYLLLTLLVGGEAGEVDDYRRFWRLMRRVVLGGGVVSGRLGPPMRDAAREVLAGAGLGDVRVQVAAHAAHLPLIGAAVSLVPAAPSALVYDFGHSFAKRARAAYEGGAVASLELLPNLPAQLLADAGPVPEAMLGLIAGDWLGARAAGERPASEVQASIAAYVVDGQPQVRTGDLYAELGALGEPAERWFSRRLSDRAGIDVRLTFVHDGTAGARVFAGEPDTAVVMLGTALGVGFAPPAPGPWRVAPDLRVRDLT